MKFLLLLLVLLFAAWLWRSSRQIKQPPPPSSSQKSNIPQDMIDCKLCGLHLPKADAVIGRRGQYCSDEHRQSAES